MSLLNYDIKKNASHRHMSVTTCTSKQSLSNFFINTHFFVKKLNVPQTTHAIIKEKKLESIDLVLQYWFILRRGYNQQGTEQKNKIRKYVKRNQH
jgi:hypothetical protein